jgi:hypothetical protein
MKLRASFLAVVCLEIVALAGSFVLASPAPQEEPGDISRVWFVKVKDGMQPQFEEALLQHWEAHRALNDPGPYQVFMVEDGEKVGQYGMLAAGRHWADFDTFDENVMPGCMADWAENVAPYVEYFTSIATATMPNLSLPPAPGASYMFAQVYEYRVDFDEMDDFIGLLEKAKKAAEEKAWPGRYTWSSLVSGGEGPLFYAVVYLESWAAFAGPEPTFEVMLEEAYGSEGAGEIMEGIYEAIEGVDAWIARLRPDLSYATAAQ